MRAGQATRYSLLPPLGTNTCRAEARLYETQSLVIFNHILVVENHQCAQA